MAGKRPRSDACTRCAPAKIIRLFLAEAFTDVKKMYVREIGFGSLLHLRCGTLRRKLCFELAKHFSPDDCTLTVHGVTLRVTETDVGKILGLSTSGIDLAVSDCDDKYKSMINELKLGDGHRYVHLTALEKELHSADLVDEREFKVKLTLYVMGYFLVPNTSVFISTTCVPTLYETDRIRTINWAKLVLNGLINGIRNHNNGNSVNVTGCLYFLMMFYLRHISFGAEFVKHTDNGCIDLALWTDAAIDQCLGKVEAIGGLDSTNVITVDVPMPMPDKIPFPSPVEVEDRGFEARFERMEEAIHSCEKKLDVLAAEVAAIRNGQTSINAQLAHITAYILRKNAK